MFSSDTKAPGEPAPEFTLENQRGELVSLAELRGKHNIVLFFYPKDDTPVCTQEACLFRDNYERMKEADAVVFGISSDSKESHRAFAERHGFPFDLLTDHDGSVRKAYGISKTLGVLPGRVTFVIDRGGIIRRVISSQLSASKHVNEALQALERLA
ncbi:MAG: peroxiredoxin [Myxococcales bacterium]|nr:peroxiredoxin [Myxococcales bacterium]